MSTSANVPGEPGRDRDDAGDPTADTPQESAGDQQGSGDDQQAGTASAEAASGSGSGAEAGAQAGAAGRSQRPGAARAEEGKTSGKDVTKQVKQESRASQAAVQSKPKKRGSGSGGDEPGLFGRIALFVRQVIAEIRKVVQPTRQELLTFSVVVIVFILAMMAYVGVLDFAIGRLVLWVFGN